jgi:replicative DNA helicase
MDKYLETVADLESEKGILGCCLTEGKLCFDIFGKCGNEAMELFTLDTNRAIWKALLEEVTNGKQPDLLQLTSVLKKEEFAPQKGWILELTDLQDSVPSALNLPYYLETAMQYALKRKAGRFLTRTYEKLLEKKGDPSKTLQEAEGELMGINNFNDDEGYGDLVKDGIADTYRRIDETKRGVAQCSGIPTGYKFLDNKIGGLHPTEVYVIAGRPGGGKTALGLNIAANVGMGRDKDGHSTEKRRPVAFFSMEMSLRELSDRLVFSEARANMVQWRTGFIPDSDYPKLFKAKEMLDQLNIKIDYRPNLTVDQIAHRARQFQLLYGIELIVIDYLQLARSKEKKKFVESRQDEVAAVSRDIKAIAKNLNVPIIALAQLNRNSARSKYEEPGLADLRESGQIEQDADFVGLLHEVIPRSEDDTIEFQNKLSASNVNDFDDFHSKHTQLIVAKQRHGSTGNLEYIFHKGLQRFDTFDYQNHDKKQERQATQLTEKDFDAADKWAAEQDN